VRLIRAIDAIVQQRPILRGAHIRRNGWKYQLGLAAAEAVNEPSKAGFHAIRLDHTTFGFLARRPNVGFSKQNDTDMIGAPQVPQMLNRQRLID
jgi:hypothetical protein